jgi:hypothetical protein
MDMRQSLSPTEILRDFQTDDIVFRRQLQAAAHASSLEVWKTAVGKYKRRQLVTIFADDAFLNEARKLYPKARGRRLSNKEIVELAQEAVNTCLPLHFLADEKKNLPQEQLKWLNDKRFQRSLLAQALSLGADKRRYLNGKHSLVHAVGSTVLLACEKRFSVQNLFSQLNHDTLEDCPRTPRTQQGMDICARLMRLAWNGLESEKDLPHDPDDYIIGDVLALTYPSNFDKPEKGESPEHRIIRKQEKALFAQNSAPALTPLQTLMRALEQLDSMLSDIAASWDPKTDVQKLVGLSGHWEGKMSIIKKLNNHKSNLPDQLFNDIMERCDKAVEQIGISCSHALSTAPKVPVATPARPQLSASPT